MSDRRCGACVFCEIDRIGCACDGAYDPDGCFRCNSNKHQRPECPPIESVTHKYQVILERTGRYLAHVTVEASNFEQAKQLAVKKADGATWHENQVVTTVETITLVPEEKR